MSNDLSLAVRGFVFGLGLPLCGLGCDPQDTSVYADTDAVSPRILQGTPTGALPEVAHIQTGKGTCTGTLVAPDVVLTAWHCLLEQNLLVRFDLPSGPHTSRVSAIARHPQFDEIHREYGNLGRLPWEVAGIDVGLVRLANPPKGLDPVALSAATPSPGTRMMMVGYGRPGPGAQSGIKRFGEASISQVFEDVPASEIERTPPPGSLSEHNFEFYEQMLDDWIDAGLTFDGYFRHDAGEAMIQPGDSGGPALIDVEEGGETVMAVAGVASSGFKTAFAHHTRVDSTLDTFILPTLEQWGVDDYEVVGGGAAARGSKPDDGQSPADNPIGDAALDPSLESSGGCSIGGDRRPLGAGVLFSLVVVAGLGCRRRAA